MSSKVHEAHATRCDEPVACDGGADNLVPGLAKGVMGLVSSA